MFDSAFDCSFSDCLTPVLITFVIVMIIMVTLHIWLYFKLVKIAKTRYGEHFQSQIKLIPKGPISQLDTVFTEPYPGIKNLEDVREVELWKLYLLDKKRAVNQSIEPKYFNLLSKKFLHSKGYNDKQINKYRKGKQWLSTKH